jgi:hypothetical protein
MQDFNPKIHVADSDFRELTSDGKLCRNGDILLPEFEMMIRDQIRRYTQVYGLHD